MDLNQFKIVENWLKDIGTAVFYLDHSFLGRPGDDQFDFLAATHEEKLGTFNFSEGLAVAMCSPSAINSSSSDLEIHDVEKLQLYWRGNSITLRLTSLIIKP